MPLPLFASRGVACGQQQPSDAASAPNCMHSTRTVHVLNACTKRHARLHLGGGLAVALAGQHQLPRLLGSLLRQTAHFARLCIWNTFEVQVP